MCRRDALHILLRYRYCIWRAAADMFQLSIPRIEEPKAAGSSCRFVIASIAVMLGFRGGITKYPAVEAANHSSLFVNTSILRIIGTLSNEQHIVLASTTHAHNLSTNITLTRPLLLVAVIHTARHSLTFFRYHLINFPCGGHPGAALVRVSTAARCIPARKSGAEREAWEGPIFMQLGTG